MSPTAIVRSPDRIDPVLGRLKGLHPKVIDLSLGRIQRLLAALGHPERALPPVVHVAGTNGKGSTVAFLRAFLEAAGWRVHAYTSPHLVWFHERIRLAGRMIEDDHLFTVLEECEAANGGHPITYFEITTAAALLAFARQPADVVLLETGLGGRLDATNVIERPAVTAITRISYDHLQFLGTTLTEIAGEKAGILKLGVPAVLAPQPAAEAAATLLARAAAVGAPVAGWRVEPRPDGGFDFESRHRKVALPTPGLAGAHQITNAGVAIACLDYLPQLRVPDAALLRGLATVEWPARLQRLTRGPLVERLPAGWQMWLDGGHNDSAGEVLAVHAARWHAAGPALDLALVFGMLATKQPVEFLKPLAGRVRHLRAVAVPAEEASLTAAAAAEAGILAGIADSEAMPDLRTAVEALIRGASRPTRILICGSLYLAGAVLVENG